MSVKIICSRNNNVFEKTASFATNGGLVILAVQNIYDNRKRLKEYKIHPAVNKNKPIAFLVATQAQFDEVFKNEGITPLVGAQLPGVVVVTESLNPPYSKDPTRHIKYPNAAAKAKGIKYMLGNKPIYRTTEWYPDEKTAPDDIFIQHDNQKEIDGYISALKEDIKKNVNQERTLEKVKILPNLYNNGIYTQTVNYNSNGKLLSLGVMEIMTQSRLVSGCCLGGVGNNRDNMTIQGLRIAYILRTKETFETIFKNEKIVPSPGTILPGRIAVEEGLTPLIASNPSFGLKFLNAECKAANIPCKVNGQPIYRNYTYVLEEKEDFLLTHDNQNEIQAVLSNRK
jgi:hypothetical protein